MRRANHRKDCESWPCVYCAKEERMDILRSWLVDEKISYTEARKRIEKEFSLKVGVSTIADFWREECVGFRVRRATRMADDFRAAMEEAPGKYDTVTIGALSQRIFELTHS